MKNEMRREFLAKRNSMPKEEQEEKSRAIIKKLLNSAEYKNARTIFVYINMGSEVRTTEFIEKT